VNITPTIDDFVGNFLSKSKDIESERETLRTPFENVIKMWTRLKLQTYGQLLHIYNIIDTIALGFALYNFDLCTFKEVKFHILPFVSIFKFTSLINQYFSNISIQYPPTKNHNEMIEKCMKGGMSTNGSQSICISNNSPFGRNVKKVLNSTMVLFDENGQYGGAQELEQGIACESIISQHDYEDANKSWFQVLSKYDKGCGTFTTGAMVECVIRVKKELHAEMGGFSPCVTKESIALYQLSPFEIFDKRQETKEGYTMNLAKYEKLLYKLGEHCTVETMHRLKWLIETQGVEIVQVKRVFGVVITKMSEQYVKFLTRKRQEANKRKDKVSDALFKLMINGNYGWCAKDNSKYDHHRYAVNTQTCLRFSVDSMQKACIKLLQTYSMDEVKNFLPENYRQLILNNLNKSADQCCIDANQKQISFSVEETFNAIHKSDIMQTIMHYDTKSVMTRNVSDSLEILYNLMTDQEQNEILNPISMIQTRRGTRNRSLRLVACHILLEAKTSIANFASKLREALKRVHLKFQLVMTDTDSLLVFIYQPFKNEETITNFNEYVIKLLSQDQDFNNLMDYSNYPKDHYLFSQLKQKYTHHFKNEFPNEELEMVIALGPKCYVVDVKDSKNKMRNKGFPQQQLTPSQYSNGQDIMTLSNYFDNLISCHSRLSTNFTTKRLTFTCDSVQTNERNMKFMKNLNSKYYVGDDGLRYIRDDCRLEKIHTLNKEALKLGLSYFCSDAHLYKCLKLEKDMVKNDIHFTSVTNKKLITC
jgi:hypothetical protein